MGRGERGRALATGFSIGTVMRLTAAAVQQPAEYQSACAQTFGFLLAGLVDVNGDSCWRVSVYLSLSLALSV